MFNFYNMLNFIRFGLLIISVILLLSFIKQKNRFIFKNNVNISIFIIIYLILELFLIEGFFGIDVGWDFIFIYFMDFITIIISIIVIFIGKRKLSKKLYDESNSLRKEYNKLIIIPLLLVVFVFIYEFVIINKAELVLVYDYQMAFIDSEITRVAVNKHYSKNFTLGLDFFKGNKKEIEYIDYELGLDKNNNVIVLNSYDDPNLEKINLDIAQKIFNNDNYKKSESTIRRYKDKENVVHSAHFTMFEGTDYYIVEHVFNEEDEWGGSIAGTAIFYKDKFISDLDVSGDLEEVYLRINLK